MKFSFRLKIFIIFIPLIFVLIISVGFLVLTYSTQVLIVRYISGSVAIISLALIVLLAIKITQPLLDLKKEIDLFSSADLGQSIQVDSKDEIVFFAVVFKKLRVNLKAKIQAIENAELRITEYDKILEQKVTAHTSELQQANNDLKKIKKEALAAIKAKDVFLANMSHEIRTPMNGVIASAELALSEEISTAAKRYLEIIHSSGCSLISIINDILDFSKIEAKRLILESKTFELNELLKNVTDLFIHKTSQKGIELLIDVAPETPLLLVGDPLRIRQIIINMVSNAVKFTVKGTISIGVEIKEFNEKTGFVKLEFNVKDTGVGIKSEHLGNLFKPFTQAESSTTRKFGGTGLGLTISKELVEMMNGQIKVESEYGKGTNFHFTLNIRYERRSKTKVELVIPQELIGLKVLVADDNLDSQAILKRILDSFDFDVTFVTTGSDALNILKSGSKYDLVITDWIMPEMNGIDLCKRIRQDLKLNIPIIMLTAFGTKDEEKKAKILQVNLFLFKPINPPLLFDSVMEALGKPEQKIRQIERRKIKFDYRDHLKGKQVLLVEDNQTNQEIGIAILHNVNIFVEVVNNGKKAVNAIFERAEPFDAVLMDIQMPELDGYEATRRIRKNPRFISLPIIAMTAYAMESDKKKCLAAGMDGYVTKPIEQEVLLKTLAQFIKVKENSTFVVRKEIGEKKEIEPSSKLPIILPGIDIKSAMDVLGIDSSTFKKILIGFMQSNTHTNQKLLEIFNQKNWVKLAKLSHSLKGSASNISAKRVEKMATDLEKACRKGTMQEPEVALVNNLTESLDELLASLKTL